LVSLNLIPQNWLHDSNRPSWDWRVAGLVSEDRIVTSSVNVQKVVKGWTGTSTVYREWTIDQGSCPEERRPKLADGVRRP
jgi:hypothetical protein